MQSRCTFNIPRFAVALTVSLILAFMPFTVNLEKFRITLERNEAHAIAPVFVGAAAFLEECALAAGFATTGEFIATGVGITSVATGLTMGTAAGISLGDTASENLDALIDAADYPDWNTLSSTEQTNWGSKNNYDAAKYNSLLAAYGLGEDYERYQNTWGSFTPGEFAFSSSANSKLEQIGDIGQNWISGAGNTLEDILNSGLYDQQQLLAWFPLDKGKYVSDPNDTEWPAGLSQTIYFDVVSNFQYTSIGGNRTYYATLAFSSPVYAFYGTKTSGGFFTYLSKSQVNWARNNNQNVPTNLTQTFSQATTQGEPLYFMSETDTGVNNPGVANNGNIEQLFNANANVRDHVYRCILYGSDVGPGEIEDYPSAEISGGTYNQNTIIIFPVGGISEDTTWEDFTEDNGGGNGGNDDPDDSTIIGLLQHIDSDIHNLNIPGEPDLTPLINKLQTIDNHIQALDFLESSDLQPMINKLQSIDDHIQALDFLESSDLQPLITYLQHIDSDLHKFTFLNGDTLKVHDGAVYTELENIYNVLVAIAQKMKNWGDVSDATDLIGDFDFDELDDKVPDLLETISDLAPFGSILLLSEMYSIMANYTHIESPELVFPFDFGGFEEQNHELVIDLSWLDDIKPLINFLCIAMLIIAIANATIRIVEIEAAS